VAPGDGDTYPIFIGQGWLRNFESLLRALQLLPNYQFLTVTDQTVAEKQGRNLRAITKGSGSRTACLTMVFKLVQSAEKRWHALRGSNLLPEVISGVEFKDGEKVQGQAA